MPQVIENPEQNARHAFKSGLWLDSNPYPKGSKNYHKWALAMGKCQLEEGRKIVAETRKSMGMPF